MNKTIFNIITGFQKAPVAVFRVSGPCALDTFKLTKFNVNKIKPNYQYYTNFYYDNKVYDNGLITYFKRPNSYTGEDCVEISIHGGIANQKMFFNILREFGFSESLPGEFSLQGYLNNKYSLNDIEDINNHINSKNINEYNNSVNSFNINKKFVTKLKNDIFNIICKLENLIEFDTDDNVV